MSRTNIRKRKIRNPHSFYETPKNCTRALLWNTNLPTYGKWLEINAGRGAIIKACNEFWSEQVPSPQVEWTAVEIQESFRRNLEPLVSPENLHMGDAIRWANRTREHYTVCVSNPSFPIAEDLFVALRHKCDYLVFLLRVGFLEAHRRYELFYGDQPDLKVLSPRPSFEKKGTDAAVYGWMIWSPQRKQKGTFEIISTIGV